MSSFKTWPMVAVAAVLVIGTACSNSKPAASAGQPPTSAAPASTNDVGVSLSQWAVAPTTTNLSAGKVMFDVTNAGTIPHEFVVLRTKTQAADISLGNFEGEPDRINEDTSGDNVGETGDMQPGTSKSLTLNLKPGHYVFLCNLPAHYQSGMHIDVTVA
jgi:uncharacterized cupredoxin-like copper-binding protein